jgi:hypothetical protein
MSREMLRIANCSAFFGDRHSAAREMVEGGPIDVLTGDYLAELTMFILWKNKQRDPGKGYATTFLGQMEEVLGTCLDRGIKVVVNAGGLNAPGLADALSTLSGRLGLAPRIAHITGDDLLDRLPSMQTEGHPLRHTDTGQTLADAGVSPVTANAYFGGWGIAEALRRGADVVIAPRVTDAAVVVGPSAWAFDWQLEDWDKLAGAVAAGHVIECGAQATGGNYSFSREIPDMVHLGFPIAEMRPDGSCVITKHEGTGGAVTVGTVTSQLLYETDGPQYLNPDVVTDFRTISLEQIGPDRVLMSGATGTPAPDSLKVCINYTGGYKQSVTFMITGLEAGYKAGIAEEGFLAEIGGADQFDEVDVQLIRPSAVDRDLNAEAVAQLTITLRAGDPAKLGRRIFNAAVSLACASYAGFHLDGEANRSYSAYGVYWPTLVPAGIAQQVVVMPDGSSVPAPLPPAKPFVPSPGAPRSDVTTVDSWGETRRLPLGMLFGARSGDKGGNANIGIFARTDESARWLLDTFGVDQLRALLPEAEGLEISRCELPLINSVNFVVRGLLGEGVASSVRRDPQAKGLAEFVRARRLDLPVRLLEASTLRVSVA